jgi:hypothetical protein
MDKINELVKKMQDNPCNIKFSDLCTVCGHYFGKPRQERTSHRIYKTPWPGDPRINAQNSKGKAKAYQVRQVLKAIEKLENQED